MTNPERRVSIITDSTANLTKSEIERFDIKVVPITTVLVSGGKIEEFVDGDLDEQVFTQKLCAKNVTASTSAPSVGAFKTEFDKLPNRDIIAITLTKKQSSTFSAAEMAAKLVGQERIKIHNSGTISRMTARQVIEAAKLAEEGKSADEIISRLEELKRKSTILVAIDDPLYVYKGGRGKHFANFVSTVLPVKIAIMIGNDELLFKNRGRTFSSMLGSIEETAIGLDPEEISVVYAGGEKSKQIANEMAEDLEMRLKNALKEPINVYYAGLALETHAGPETVGIGVISKKVIPEKLIFKSK